MKIAVGLLAGPMLLACTCMPFPEPRPCEPDYFTEAIFVGKAIRVERVPGPEDPWDRQDIRAEFEVIESFRGVTEKQRVEVLTDNSSCGFGFAQNKNYLVYASRVNKSGPLGIRPCSGHTSEARVGNPYLDSLRQLKSGQGPSQIYGFVTTDKNEFQYAPEGRAEAVRGITVRLHAAQKPLRETQTDANGRYEFGQLTGGQSFSIELLMPDVADNMRQQKVDVPAGGCSRLNFLVPAKAN